MHELPEVLTTEVSGHVGAPSCVGRHQGGVRGAVVLERLVALVSAEDAEAFVAGDRVEPGPEPLRIAELRCLGGGDQEGVVEDVGSGCGVLGAEHRPGVVVQAVGVRRVGLLEATPYVAAVSRDQQRDDLAITHGSNLFPLASRLVE